MFHVKHRKPSKYGSRKITVDGISFDSKREARRYCQLRDLERAGKITDLELQRKFELVPTQREPSTFTKTGKEKPGKAIELSVSYVADFCYREGGALVVEDAKGVRTPEYVIKRKLMLSVYGIRIKEV